MLARWALDFIVPHRFFDPNYLNHMRRHTFRVPATFSPVIWISELQLAFEFQRSFELFNFLLGTTFVPR
jgi:hypothetical protein